MLWRRIADHANWRHVYKARVPQPGSPNGDANTPAHTNARPCTVVQGLVLLEYLCRAGSDQVVADALEHVFDLDALTRYQYINEDGTDVGGNGTHTRSWPRACVGVSKCVGVGGWVGGCGGLRGRRWSVGRQCAGRRRMWRFCCGTRMSYGASATPFVSPTRPRPRAGRAGTRTALRRGHGPTR
jgi:hypothetical protein